MRTLQLVEKLRECGGFDLLEMSGFDAGVELRAPEAGFEPTNRGTNGHREGPNLCEPSLLTARL